MPHRPFHVTVGTTPDNRSREGVSLARDIDLAKAALLYADRATLVSPSSNMLVQMAAFAEAGVNSMSKKQRFDHMVEMVQALPGGEAFAEIGPLYHSLRKKRHLSPEERRVKLRIEGEVSGAWTQLRTTMLSTLDAAGGGELFDALDSGLLELHPLNLADPSTDGSTDDVVWAFADAIMEAVQDPSTYLLLDDGSGGLLRSFVREGHLGDVRGGDARGRQVTLAASLFERLPQFDLASLQEVLDVRRELDRHVSRFRAAMAEYSDSIEAASWDEDFAADAEAVFVRDVAPAVRDIEDAVASATYLRALTSRFTDKLSGLAPVLSLALTQAPTLPDIVGLAAAGATGVANAYLAGKEHRDGRRSAEQNKLFFYYGAGRGLR